MSRGSVAAVSWPRETEELCSLAGLAIAALTALRLGLLVAGRFELYGDEAQYWTYGEELAFGHYSKPPLIGWLAHATTALGGRTEAWVRIASPLCHGATALLLLALARRSYAGAVSYASLLLSTDTPLLLFWTLGLLSAWRLKEGGSWHWGLLLGIGLGGGLLSKYAMIYFPIGLIVYAAFSPAGRELLRRGALWLGLGLGLLLFAPNIWWNLQHGGVTLLHLAENANLDETLLRPDEALEFLVSQFGVVGPVFFSAFLVRLALCRRRPLDERERFLVAFSLPVLLIIQAQSLLAGANANWAATSVPAALLLAVGWLHALGQRLWLWLAFAVNGMALVALAAAVAWPGIVISLAGDRALEELRGWRAFAAEVERRADACGCAKLLLDHRFELAELWFYGGLDQARLRMWLDGEISNHYELTRPLPPPARERILYVTERSDPSDVLRQLGRVTESDSFSVPTGPRSTRRYHAYVVDPVNAIGRD